jgi:hypothetical protein
VRKVGTAVHQTKFEREMQLRRFLFDHLRKDLLANRKYHLKIRLSTGEPGNPATFHRAATGRITANIAPAAPMSMAGTVSTRKSQNA